MPFHNKIARLGRQIGRLATSPVAQEARRLVVFDERPVLRLIRGDLNALPWAALEVATILPVGKAAKTAKLGLRAKRAGRLASIGRAAMKASKGDRLDEGLRSLVQRTGARTVLPRGSPLYHTMFRQYRELTKLQLSPSLASKPPGKARKRELQLYLRPMRRLIPMIEHRTGVGSPARPPL